MNQSATSVRPAIEQLENKTLLTVNSLLVGTELRVFTDAGEALTVSNDTATGNVAVTVDGAPATGLPSTSSAGLTSLRIITSAADDTIDLSQLTLTDFASLTTVHVDSGDGNDTLIGSPDFAETFIAGDGNDSITGQGADDSVFGGDGNDSIVGAAGNELLDGGDGADTITGGGGTDSIVAGDGNDSVSGEAGSDTIDAGQGHDFVDGGTEADSIHGGAGHDTVLGGDGNDTIIGGSEHDSLLGEAGDDFIDGQSGRDSIFGGTENDTLNGGKSNDSIDGGFGNDVLNGNGGKDTLNGNVGDDRILGGGGRDSINGQSGNDTLNGQGQDDTILGGGGFDSMVGGSGSDLISSGVDVSTVLISISNATVTEGDMGTTQLTFDVNLSQSSTGTVSVDFATSPGTALTPDDFVSTTGTLTVAPGDVAGQITVDVVGDTIDEADEVFSVTLTNPVNALLNDAMGIGTITDDDDPPPIVTPMPFDALDVATNYLSNNFADFGLTLLDVENFIVTSQYVTDHLGVTHIYLRQTHQGLPIVGADLNVNVLSDGTVLNVHSAFVGAVDALGLSATPAITADAAFASLSDELAEELDDTIRHRELIIDPALSLPPGEQVSGSPLTAGLTADDVDIELDKGLTLVRTQFDDRLQWAKTESGGVELVWTINTQTQDFPGWFDSSVSATTGELVRNEDWVSYATYNVFDSTTESPLLGTRSLQIDVDDPIASPFGWHDNDGVAGAEFTDTRGNNVFAQPAAGDNPIVLFITNGFGTGVRPDGGTGLVFDFPFDDTMAPSTYDDALTTNLFYTNNVIHDVLYQYGFDEASGNFQSNNYGNGGVAGDQVSANARAGANLGFANNAFMATPPDGTPPTMAMFEFTFTTPNRTSDVENGIIIHEYVHGLTNRLTGGPANSGALQGLQSGGMGEGWSDFYSIMFSQQVGDTANDARPLGNYVLGQPQNGVGIRTFPYSFDRSINPLTFGDHNVRLLNGFPHDDGEIWVASLWDMNWLLIDGIAEPDCNGNLTPGLGFDPDLYNGTGGNNVALQLVTDGLKLQPANPTFIEARDAILTADMINNNGAYQRQIWTAFARRGMGFSASAGANSNSTSVVEAFDMPPELGGIQFDQLLYSNNSPVGITVCDADAVSLGNTLDVTVTTSEGDLETLTLTRTTGLAPTFFGSVLLQRGATNPGDSVLNLDSESTILTASYIDMNNGQSVIVTLQALAAATDAFGDTLEGNNGADTLISGRGDDSVNGGGGNDSISSDGGDDSILGGAGDDRIDAGEGDDTIDGQAGDDTIDAGSGINQITWSGSGAGDDVAVASDGAHSLIVQGDASANSFSVMDVNGLLTVAEGSASFTLNQDISEVSIQGGAGADTITVSGSLVEIQPMLLEINGEVGDDTLVATGVRLGNVRLRLNGGDGSDTISGSDDRDAVDGGLGDDSINGNEGDDELTGSAGRDTIFGDAGLDVLFGNDGNDNLFGGDGNDSILGGFGDDFINGDDGDDSLEGGFGEDTLSGSAGNDSVEGNQGRDTVQGGAGADTLKGGTESDIIRGQGGDDSILGGDGDDTIFGNGGNDVIDAGDGDDSVQSNNGNDVVSGGDGDDTLLAGGGRDTVIGGDGNDALNGAGGADLLFGGEGSDSLRGKGSTDRFNSGEGIDSLPDLATGESDDSSLTFTLSLVQALSALNGV